MVSAELLWVALWVGVPAAYGAAFASFAELVGERAARGQTPGGVSVCACGHPIPPWRNIPVASWLLQRGRARCCAAPIPARYVVGEAAVAFVGGAVAAAGMSVGVAPPAAGGVAVAVAVAAAGFVGWRAWRANGTEVGCAHTADRHHPRPSRPSDEEPA